MNGIKAYIPFVKLMVAVYILKARQRDGSSVLLYKKKENKDGLVC